ncbi:hypothetical protein H4N58_20210 [Mumia sp. ZJ1417]|uniref:DUF6049 family protein n=1 Tax=unclassified Mumia TaxID=2621872 RepID=UPI00141F485F|nr:MULTISPECIES: DUF6049 family protein [unclassified Mumia]QMW66417.1 hypothetical protein H4N58_20210 [Mumia sp. ZJ1417]
MTRAEACSSRPAHRGAVRGLLATALIAVLAALLPTATVVAPARAADADRLAVTIDALSPATLSEGDTLTISGRITNPSSKAWSRLRVHLVMPSVPLDDAADLDEALGHPSAEVTGTRHTSGGAVVAAGDLAPGDTTTFQLQVRYAELRVTSEGVYPVGVHVLATGPDGTRSPDAVGRSYTSIPFVGDAAAAAARVSMVWPFIAPVQRDERNRYVDTAGLVQSVSPGGRLRRLLDLARSDDSSPSTVLLDPALLDALRDIAADSYGPNRQGGPGGTALYVPEGEPTPSPDADAPEQADPEAQPETSGARQRVATFLTDLVSYAQRHPVWAVPYGRPDSFAITRRSAGESGATVVEAATTATQATLAQFGITARTVSWPPNGISNASRLAGSRQLGTELAILSPEVLPGWTPDDGTALRAEVGGAPMDVVVVDPGLQAVSSATNPTLALRQRIASRAALGALGDSSRRIVVLPSASFDPGSEWARAQFHDVFDAAWIRPVAADALLGSGSRRWTGRIALPPRTNQRPITEEQVAAAARIVDSGSVVSELLGDDVGRDVFYAQSASLAVSQDWRGARTRGVQHAEAQAASVERVLDRVSVSASSFVTLSGSSGRFPITITNSLSSPVTVGVRFTSDDASARIEDIAPQQISAGQSVTITVSADVGQATTTTFTAALVTSGGSELSEPARFTVRSSVVGRVIWFFFGLAMLLVVIAVVRRVVKGRKVETLHDETEGELEGDAEPDPTVEPASSTEPARSEQETDA